MVDNSKRRIDFDLIRIFACATVLIGHFNASVSGYDYSGSFLYDNGIIPTFYFDCVNLGHIGNGLFFLLSGAALMLPRDGGKEIKCDPLRFWFKRAKALFPTFWIAYLGATCVHLLHYKGLSNAPWKNLFWSILGMDGYAASRGWVSGALYQVGEWFLGCILLCYLFWPFIIWLWKRIPAVLLMSGTFILYIAAVIISNGSITSVPLRLCEMIAGGCFSRYISTVKNWKLPTGSFLIALLCICGRNMLHSITVTFALCWAIFVGLSWIVACMPTVFSALGPAIMKLAGLTYPLFLVHHKLASILASGFNLEYFPYRYTIVLFVAYLAIAVFLAYWLNRASKKCVSLMEQFWRFCKGTQAQKEQALRPER